jgi:hypothetical protein
VAGGKTYINLKYEVPQRDEFYTKKKIVKGLNVQKIYGAIRCSVPGQESKEFGCIDLKFSEFMEAAKIGGVPREVQVSAAVVLTLILLMSYICGAPCKTRNFNVVYIWTYV